MIEHSIVFIGLDTHKEFIEIAYIEDQRTAEPIHFGEYQVLKSLSKNLLVSFNPSTQKPLFTLFMKLGHVVTGFIAF